ncbi:acyl-CoA synthetase [Kordiimonas lipolytica]|uniref:Acyl-CoA synthetase n=1 Tax=Kordiimonas lipolytica TaxID=1662421 RepID=A0ABV8U7B0_9PROT|nr:acyl-CoA synthetase [Kordiimonas lipolytica]
MTDLPIIQRAKGFADRTAFFGRGGEVTYQNLLHRSAAVASGLLAEKADLEEERIAFLLPTGADYAATQWGIWRAGGIAVPINGGATVPEIEHALTCAGVRRVVVAANRLSVLGDLPKRLGLEVLDFAGLEGNSPLPQIAPTRRAMILFTSGTTNKPKGVVSTHASIEAQVTALVEAWAWQANDRIPLFLPMHHLHGILNILCCGLWSGAAIEPFDKFDADAICARVAEGAYTLFMAVPTIYVKLLKWLDAPENAGKRDCVIKGFGAMRLMVSGSAALPASIHKEWSDLTGQVLLERYGMTEIGMALSNPYAGERRAGMVGLPMPRTDIQLVDDAGKVVSGEGAVGEIWVKGPAVFREYWDNPKATAESFAGDWFKTGDIATLEGGYYRIMGRSSVDIIKSGGYKLSALEIEAALLEHPNITECAVVGLADDEWGEIVAAAIGLREGATLTLEELQAWASARLSAYKLPRALLLVDALPRNAMGKVTKPAVKALFT